MYAGRGSESSDKASERLISLVSTRVLRVAYFMSFSISFVLLVACSLLLYVDMPLASLIICTLLFLTSTATALKRFTSSKVSIFGVADSRGVDSKNKARATDFNLVLGKGEMLHRARTLGIEAYTKARREFLQVAYDHMASGLEPLERQVSPFMYL